MTASLPVLDVGHALRARIRRWLDALALVGCSAGLVAQIHSGVNDSTLLSIVATCALATVALLGVLGHAPWSPIAYVVLVVIANPAYLTAYGPQLGVGVLYVFVLALAFMYLSPAWRWGAGLALVATVVAVGVAFGIGDLGEPPRFALGDAASWKRTTVTAITSTIAIALVVGLAMQHLIGARRGIEKALEVELAARHEKARLEREIGRTQRTDLIVELAAEVGANIGAALAAVSANAEALARELDDDESRQCLADVLTATQTARGTMRSLTVFSACDGAAETRCEVVAALTALPKMVRRTIPSRIRLVHEVDPALSAWVALGATDLLRILGNLVLNARDAIADAGTIRVALSRSGPLVRIEIRDDGSGMDAPTLARLFQPFFTTKPVGRGTGLGLATARILVERAGGRITATSELGRGSCFTIELPTVAAPDHEPRGG